MSALMIAKITVKDPEKFQEYIAKTREVAATYGAKLLYRGNADRVLTGESKEHDLIIIVTFPSIEKIDEWYRSDAYRPLMALREAGADMEMTSYELMA